MQKQQQTTKPSRKQRGKLKTIRLPVKIVPMEGSPARKPDWIRAKAPIEPEVVRLKTLIKEHNLHTVCEEASCPNLGECFSHGTATFMIMGEICTRRCPFCDVASGRPRPLDEREPQNLALAVALMGLDYVVITSVDRDDLSDGGASHFVACIENIRGRAGGIKIEILVPDFRRKMEKALDKLGTSPPDIFNHNLETVPRLYRKVRPGADYQWSLQLLQQFKRQHQDIPTKSGLMLGMGETLAEVKNTIEDLRQHGCNMLTLGQYLQPSRHHLQVERFITPEEFMELGEFARKIGFSNVASAPLVRSSYHADLQAAGAGFENKIVNK
jgi:lipoic acid synthetase